ncbi:hypothetical protein PGT21_036701 [Puccinia graminis f. sp. tritici]|uniref:Uncharacterized protein n=1 Tax=Puccinia graminis f. sp. tritici TaxID=56615 RepID=A0A5B0PKT0_PUCGR|nr:hypothetical protein PGT21_036701 [Puccinia graminis f. sp. tritici]
MYCIGHTYDSTIGRSSTGSIIHPRVIDRILDHLRGELADSFSVLDAKWPPSFEKEGCRSRNFSTIRSSDNTRPTLLFL